MISFWVFRDTATSEGEIWLSTGPPGRTNQSMHIGFRADHRFTFAFWGNDLDTPDVYPPDGQWHNWICIYNRNNNQRSIYRDGMLVASDTSQFLSNISGNLTVGGWISQESSSNGIIDELAIYDLINFTYINPLSNGAAPPAGREFYYQFNETTDVSPAVSEPSIGGGLPLDLIPQSGLPISYAYDNDCNNNGIPDQCDIDAGTSQDCNNNKVPDECDISNGTSSDSNKNGIPDECDNDCNNNGVLDELDIDNGTSQDCNNNGLPDECDIAAGTSLDTNMNGIPDECDQIENITQGTHWETIALATDNVQTGDTIVLSPGTYTESKIPLYGSTFTLRSTNPYDPAIVQSTTISSIFSIMQGCDIKFDGISFINTLVDLNWEKGDTADDLTLTLTRCLFDGGGGIFANGPTTINCTATQFFNYGIAIHIDFQNKLADDPAILNIDHCVFAAGGTAIHAYSGPVNNLVNTTIRSSLLVDNTFGINYEPEIQSFTFIENSIIHRSTTSYFSVNPDSLLILQNTNMSGFPHVQKNGSFDADPLFIDPDGPDNNPATYYDNDYRLMPNSPSVDTGLDSSVGTDTHDLDNDGNITEQVPLDLDSNPRFIRTVDMGPYEYQGPPPCTTDLTSDGVLDFFDISAFLTAFSMQDPIADFTEDGLYDFFDISAFLTGFSAGCP